MQAHDVPEIAPIDYSGFEVIADTRILDLRGWATGDHPGWYTYRRARVRKLTAGANEFVMRVRPTTSVEVRPLNRYIPAVLRLRRDAKSEGDKPFRTFDLAFDLASVAAGEVVDLPVEYLFPELAPGLLQSSTFSVDAETELFSGWLLLPAGREIEGMVIMRYVEGDLASPERIAPANELMSEDGRILSFTLLNLEPGFLYECRWTFRE
jgi:hypothetical protein